MRRRKFFPRIRKSELEQRIVELSRQGLSSSLIGQKLKEEYGVTRVKKLLGKKISKIMQEAGTYPEIPEDLLQLLKKAVKLHEHLQQHRKDKHSKHGLELLESRIRRLASYYIRRKKLPPGWRYSYEEARLLVQR